MNANVTQESLELLKKLGVSDALLKSITTASGLVSYDLQAPAKNLYPINTPIIKTIPRVRGSGGTATNWKVIQSLTGSGYDSMPWVKEGQRTARMSYNAVDKSASYKTIGEEDQITFEATSAAMGFEDVRATGAMRLLQKMMVKEEHAVLGGNFSTALGTPTAPTMSVAAGGTLPDATYVCYVVALTYEGYKNSSLSAGIATTQVITGADGLTYTLKGGSSQKSAASSGQATSTQKLRATTPVVNGAVAYAWYVGTAGNEKLEAITTINSVEFSAPLAGTGQAATAIIADNSKNDLAFDGLMYSAFLAGSGAYIKNLPTGTAGAGTPFTASGRGSITEIDAMLYAMWQATQTGPSVIWINAQEQTNITNKVLTNASGPLLRYNTPASEPYAIAANGVVKWYYNPYGNGGGANGDTPGGGSLIPLVVHPQMPPGTIYADCRQLPAQYVSNQTPNVVEVHTRRDYYEIDWPLKTRQFEMGVYAEEVLACYAPFTLGIINNIANA